MSAPRQVLEEYRLERVLTMTPASTVFLATAPESEATVALKVLSSAGLQPEPARVERFLSWVEAVSALGLAAIPEVVDLGETPDGSVFLVTRLIAGEPVESLIGEDPIRIVGVLSQAVEALARLAEAGLVHHNLSPDNLMLESVDRLRLLGLGTAAFFGTEGGALLGHSPAWDRFAAPELLDAELGKGTPAWRADLYALALISCELLQAEVTGPGSPGPVVRLPDPTRDRLAAAEALELGLADALRFDPASRTVAWTELAETLDACVAVEPDGGFEPWARTEAPTPPPAEEEPTPRPEEGPVERPAADPNQTNPMLIPEEIGAEPLPPRELQDDIGETRVAEEGLPLPEAVDATVVLDGQPAPPRPAGPSAPPVLERALDLARGAARRIGTVSARTVVVAAVAAILVATLWTMLGRRPAPAPPPLPTVIVATPVPLPEPEPTPALHPALAEAELLLQEGDLDGVRTVIDGIPADEIDGFTEHEREVFDGVIEVLEGVDRSTALDNLRKGLETGSIDRLHRALRVLGRLDDGTTDEPEIARDLERARQAIRLHTLLWRANRAGDRAQVLERAGDLMKALPAYSGSAKLRREAAAGLESEAAEAAARGNWKDAVQKLEALRRFWPERAGLEGRIRELEAARDRDLQLTAALEEARAVAAGGDPEGAIAKLSALRPTPLREAELTALGAQLEQRLAAMDASPPEVSLGTETDLGFRKNQEFRVALVIRDDYRVERVFAMVRPESAVEYREIEVARIEGDRWALEVPPALHANEDVLFYVVAVDRSGHRGTLGSAEKPIRADRKKWWQR